MYLSVLRSCPVYLSFYHYLFCSLDLISFHAGREKETGRVEEGRDGRQCARNRVSKQLLRTAIEKNAAVRVRISGNWDWLNNIVNVLECDANRWEVSCSKLNFTSKFMTAFLSRASVISLLFLLKTMRDITFHLLYWRGQCETLVRWILHWSRCLFWLQPTDNSMVQSLFNLSKFI